jgi:O-antigen/teichoic acid export membrane protein
MVWTKQVLVTGLVGRWKSDPGFWSLVDQGSVSAGNFVTTILLARALTPSEYGIYALLFALMLSMVSLYSAVIAYGLSIHGAAATDAALGPLTGGSLILTAGTGTVLGAATGLVAVFFHRMSLYPWILLALLFWQFQETTRRALMSRLRHREAVWGDALSYLGQSACLGCLFVGHRLTLTYAFEAMAATSAAGALLQVVQLKLTLRDFRGAVPLLQKFWGVGRWALFANAVQAFVNQSLLWVLALAGTTAVASFQSLLNLVRVTNPVMFAIGGILLPTVAAKPSDLGAGLRAARRYGLLGALVLLPYFVVIFVFPGTTLQLLYGASSQYAGLGTDLRVLILGSAFAYATYVLGMYYYGFSRGAVVLRCGLVAAATGIFGGLVLVMQAGVFGATLAYGLTFGVQTVALAWFLRRDAPSASTAPLRAMEP